MVHPPGESEGLSLMLPDLHSNRFLNANNIEHMHPWVCLLLLLGRT